MTPRTSGFDRDIRLIRRRAWLFIPFFLLGIAVALFYSRVSGKTNAIGTISIQTVVHEVYSGGDRGFRTFEADQMTREPVFKKEVIDAIGDPNFDYSRFGIALSTVSIGDGVSSGTETVAIQDANPSLAQKYRNAWVNVFIKEFMSTDGLFRTTATNQRKGVADQAEKNYATDYTKLVALAKAEGVTAPLDQIAQPSRDRSVTQGLNTQQADLLTQLAEVQAAEKTIAAGADAATASALASNVLQTTVSGDPAAALKAKEATLTAAIATISQQRTAMSDGSFSPEFQSLLDNVRQEANVKDAAYQNYNDGKAAAVSVRTDVAPVYTQSGGKGASLIGRTAIVLVITIVFGLIAIYAWEWLSQVRAGTEDDDSGPATEPAKP
ncbi:MAG TPA: hypothetical protein VN697_14935 [Tepidiformaceae bacterium]|nr:hypothetical protein [Tepidiformaceae bacterium]